MRTLTAIMTAVLGCAACPVAALACCMVPLGFAGSISQNAQQAIVFHHDHRQELVLRINYEIAGESMPDRFAWVITVPSEPDAYRLTEPQIFDAVDSWSSALVTPRPPAASGGCRLGCGMARVAAVATDANALLEFGRQAEVGPYLIQPVRARGIEALEALNIWLTENGFPSEAPEHMQYFVEQKFTFLCIRVSPPEGGDTVQPAGLVPPLQLSFETERPYYPLRFSSRQGVFDLQLVVLTGQPLDYEQSADSLERIRWVDRRLHRNVAVAAESFPQPLADAYNHRHPTEWPATWHLNVLRCRDVNENDSIAAWQDDIFLATSESAPVYQATIADPAFGWLALVLGALWVMHARLAVRRRRSGRPVPVA